MYETRPLTSKERDTLGQVYTNCEIILKRNIYNLLANKSLCDDCMQETMFLAMRHIDKFMQSNNKEGWLVRASTYATLKTVEKENRWAYKTIPLEKMINVLRYSVIATDHEGRSEIVSLIKKHLSKKNGEFFELVMTTNKSHKELAVYLSSSESAIRSKWKRMIDEIRELPDEIKNNLEFL